MKLSLATAIALAALASGCTSPSATPSESPGFTADAQNEEATVFLRGRVEGSRVVVDVVARGPNDVHGVAFRIAYDPNALRLVSAAASERWSGSALSRAKEGIPGQLAVLWTEVGAAPGLDATTPTTLGTLVFDRRGNRGTNVSFVVDRSKVVDRLGAPLTMAWRGGTVGPS